MNVAELGLVRQGGENVLVCPACGDDGLLMISATVAWREREEDALSPALTVHVDMDGMRCAQKKCADHYAVVSILLHCQECAKEMRIDVGERDEQTVIRVQK
jgi:predicted NodU family carbamoyl transferase